jgi:hypothetical protein
VELIYFFNWKKVYKTNNNIDVDSLKEKGYLKLESGSLNPELENKLIYSCEKIIQASQKNEKAGKAYLHQILSKSDVLNSPSLVDFALSNEVLSVVGSYLGSKPVLTQIKILKSIPTENDKSGSQLFHCDHDDVKQVKVFVNLINVNINSGPLVVVDSKTSENYRKKIDYRWGGLKGHLKDEEHLELKNSSVPLLGEKGGVSFVDTSSSFHKGSADMKNERYVFYLQYLSRTSFVINPFLMLLPSSLRIKMKGFPCAWMSPVSKGKEKFLV